MNCVNRPALNHALTAPAWRTYLPAAPPATVTVVSPCTVSIERDRRREEQAGVRDGTPFSTVTYVPTACREENPSVSQRMQMHIPHTHAAMQSIPTNQHTYTHTHTCTLSANSRLGVASVQTHMHPSSLPAQAGRPAVYVVSWRETSVNFPKRIRQLYMRTPTCIPISTQEPVRSSARRLKTHAHK